MNIRRLGLLLALLTAWLLNRGAAPVEIIPWDGQHHTSPDGRFAVFNTVIHKQDDGMMDNGLQIQDLQTGKVAQLTGYAAYAQLLWSPNCNNVIVNIHIGSNLEYMMAFRIISDKKGIHPIEYPAISFRPAAAGEILHEYTWGTRWLNDERFIAQHRYDFTAQKARDLQTGYSSEVTEWYRVTYGKRSRLIKSRQTGAQ